MRIGKKLAMMGVLLAGLLLVGQANAALVGYEFQIFGNNNVPTVTLENLSSSADITRFIMTIGNTVYNFDAAYHEVLTGITSFTRVSPDANDSGGVRSDQDEYTFVGFAPGGIFKFDTDVDRDNANTTENYRTVLFNNGAVPNSTLTVEFTGGWSLSGTLPDYSGDPPYVFSQVQVIPLPASLWLVGGGLLALAGLRRKK